MEFMRMRNPRRAGFTLVEMLIVLGILVLMLALVVPRVLGSRKKAKIDLAKAQIGMLRGALEHYYLDCDEFPTTEQGLEALVSQPADLPETVQWNGPYVSGNISLDPWGNEYQYEYPPSHGTMDSPDIWSFGPNGEDDAGEEDDITNWGGGSGAVEGEVVPGETRGPKPETGSMPREPRKPRSEAGPMPREPRKPKPTVPKAIRSDRPEVP